VAVRRARSRNAVRPVLTTGACMAATLLLVVPLLTLEVDARGGGGHGCGHGAADTVPHVANAEKSFVTRTGRVCEQLRDGSCELFAHRGPGRVQAEIRRSEWPRWKAAHSSASKAPIVTRAALAMRAFREVLAGLTPASIRRLQSIVVT
jgi:hypothetical protein